MADTLAYRTILGVLVPDLNTVLQPELDDLRPPGVSNQTARFSLGGNMFEELASAARQLTACKPEALLIGLSTEFLPGGISLLQHVMAEVAKLANLPIFTAPHATLAALQSLGVRRVGVITPFDADANEHVREAFETHGFAVAAIHGLACPGFEAIAHTPLDAIRRAFEQVNRAECEGLVQVGTGLPVLHLVEELEQRFAKPVVGCNAALYWAALRGTGIDDPCPGFGRLLAEC